MSESSYLKTLESAIRSKLDELERLKDNYSNKISDIERLINELKIKSFDVDSLVRELENYNVDSNIIEAISGFHAAGITNISNYDVVINDAISNLELSKTGFLSESGIISSDILRYDKFIKDGFIDVEKLSINAADLVDVIESFDLSLEVKNEIARGLALGTCNFFFDITLESDEPDKIVYDYEKILSDYRSALESFGPTLDDCEALFELYDESGLENAFNDSEFLESLDKMSKSKYEEFVELISVLMAKQNRFSNMITIEKEKPLLDIENDEEAKFYLKRINELNDQRSLIFADHKRSIDCLDVLKSKFDSYLKSKEGVIVSEKPVPVLEEKSEVLSMSSDVVTLFNVCEQMFAALLREKYDIPTNVKFEYNVALKKFESKKLTMDEVDGVYNLLVGLRQKKNDSVTDKVSNDSVTNANNYDEDFSDTFIVLKEQANEILSDESLMVDPVFSGYLTSLKQSLEACNNNLNSDSIEQLKVCLDYCKQNLSFPNDNVELPLSDDISNIVIYLKKNDSEFYISDDLDIMKDKVKSSQKDFEKMIERDISKVSWLDLMKNKNKTCKLKDNSNNDNWSYEGIRPYRMRNGDVRCSIAPLSLCDENKEKIRQELGYDSVDRVVLVGGVMIKHSDDLGHLVNELRNSGSYIKKLNEIFNDPNTDLSVIKRIIDESNDLTRSLFDLEEQR